MLDKSKFLSGHPADVPPMSWSASDLKTKRVAAATNASLTA
jgi:hypothetical protein